METIEKELRGRIVVLQKQLDEDFDERFKIEIAEAIVIHKKKMRVKLEMLDTTINENKATDYLTFYKLGSIYMFHNLWDRVNQFVLESLKNKK